LRTTESTAIVASMTAGRPRRLELEVRFEREPIEGRLYGRDKDCRLELPFSGWLGLMAAIEAARIDDRGPKTTTEGEHENSL
jgi:hypothetical protein